MSFGTILLIVLILILGLSVPVVKPVAAQGATVSFTILHTNDFHGQLECFLLSAACA